MRPDLKFEYANNLYPKITDGTHDSPKQKKSGKHLVTSKHIKGRNIDFESAYLISEDDFNKINERSSVDQWDVIVSMIGEYCGFCYIERNSFIDYAVKNVGLYKAGSKIEAEWLYYYLTSPIGKQYLNFAKSGSSQPYLTLGGLRNLPILVPNNQSKKERIIKVLSDIDEKIELNNKINTELEAMAKLIYDYWFVQFDFPDANGKPYKSSGGKMVYNEALKREIPDGWDVCLVSDKLSIGSGYPFSSLSYLVSGKYKIITIKNVQDSELNTEKTDFLNDIPVDLNPFCILGKSDVLMSLTGNVGRICLVNEEDLLLNQRVGKFLCDSKWQHFFFCLYLRPEIRLWLQGIATGCAQKNLSPINAVDKLHAFPTESILESFNDLVSFNFKLIIEKSIETQKLRELRDWLLPMLMNGQVTVKDS